MTDKVQLIKEWVENLKKQSHTIPNLGINALAGFQLACDDVIAFIDSIPEEHASEDLEEAANFYANTHIEWFDSEGNPCVMPAFKAGAEWQKQKNQESSYEANCTTKSDDLEEEIDNYIKDNFFGSGSMGFFSNRTKQELNSIDVANIAHHFAEWQKDKMNLLLQTEYEKGLFYLNEAMMKDAVEGEVRKGYVGNQIVISSKDGSSNYVAFDASYADAFCVGDKVKIIIVKEE